MNNQPASAATQPHVRTDRYPPTVALQSGPRIEALMPVRSAAREPEPGAQLTIRQRRLLSVLVADPDIQAAARAAGVGRTTAHRWLRQPAFRDELARQRDAVLSEALGSVKAHATRAVAELMKLLNTGDERLRRQICNDILGHALRVRELEDIERRLAILEKALANNGKRRPAAEEERDEA